MSEYLVLARKYRPKQLSELIGQDVLVKTLKSAIEQSRIPHAFVLTGIRGVGKTSTARIIARSLLCTGANGELTAPTTAPCGTCSSCMAISADNHVDVIEVDAASRTGVDNIREIIDQVNYSPVMGRYKIYIIDEVHMLSKQAFNALLKTLEEPPSHVKFVFATTEVRKIPVTILSRCMRFDLPRVSAEILFEHFSNISQKENVVFEDEALRIIAGASEGSVRDGLSLLDQAIAISQEKQITALSVRSMLGQADKDRIYEVVASMLDGDFETSLNRYTEINNLGVEGISFIRDLLEIIHKLCIYSAVPELLSKKLLSEFELRNIAQITQKTSMAQLTRLWQIIARGIEDAKTCPDSNMAAEMVLMRACYAAKLPTPEEILSGNVKIAEPKSSNVVDISAQKKTLESRLNPEIEEKISPENPIFAESPQSEYQASTPQPQAIQTEKIIPQPSFVDEEIKKKMDDILAVSEPKFSAPKTAEQKAIEPKSSQPEITESIITEEPIAEQISQQEILESKPQKLAISQKIESFEQLVAFLEAKKENLLCGWLADIKVSDFDAEKCLIILAQKPENTVIDMAEAAKKVSQALGQRWVFEVSQNTESQGEVKTINQKHQEALEKRKNEAINSPVIQNLLKTFEGAEITSVTEIKINEIKN